ncbi:MAG: methyltransferase domain-containing protein [Deltaproteobacteria bacterium]|nr:methyltransferase domain-containing protein [Deltaproteobacteria bacterium]
MSNSTTKFWQTTVPEERPEWSEERFRQACSYWQSKILLTALRLDLFTVLADQDLSAAALTTRLGAAERGLTALLDALVALGLLTKQDHRYTNTPFARTALDRTKPSFCGYTPLFDAHCWKLWDELEDTVRSGSCPGHDSVFHADPVGTELLLRGLHADALRLAPALAARLDLRRRRRMLDLGGGAGTYAITFCQTQPGLSAVIFDLPGPLTLAYELVSAAGLTDHISLVVGDFRTATLPRGFDLVLLSNILHGQSAETNQQILSEVFAVLEPGGELVLRDVLMNEDRTTPVFGALFAVNLVLHSPAGRCYTYREVSSWLAAAGFHDLEVLETNAVLRAFK